MSKQNDWTALLLSDYRPCKAAQHQKVSCFFTVWTEKEESFCQVNWWHHHQVYMHVRWQRCFLFSIFQPCVFWGRWTDSCVDFFDCAHQTASPGINQKVLFQLLGKEETNGWGPRNSTQRGSECLILIVCLAKEKIRGKGSAADNNNNGMPSQKYGSHFPHPGSVQANFL